VEEGLFGKSDFGVVARLIVEHLRKTFGLDLQRIMNGTWHPYFRYKRFSVNMEDLQPLDRFLDRLS